MRGLRSWSNDNKKIRAVLLSVLVLKRAAVIENKLTAGPKKEGVWDSGVREERSSPFRHCEAQSALSVHIQTFSRRNHPAHHKLMRRFVRSLEEQG